LTVFLIAKDAVPTCRFLLRLTRAAFKLVATSRFRTHSYVCPIRISIKRLAGASAHCCLEPTFAAVTDKRLSMARRGRIAALTVFLALIGGLACAAPQVVVLQGSTTFATTVAGPYAKLVEAETNLSLDLVPNKSSLGLLALLEKKADLAMLSTSLAYEVDFLRQSNPALPFDRLQAFEIARTRAAFVVHPGNPVRRASLDDIRRILTGEITNWKALGGADLPVRVVAVRQGGGVLGTVETRLLGPGHITAPDVIRVQVGTQVVRVVAQEPGALGITQLSIVNASGSVELATDAPIAQVLSLVSLDEPTPQAVLVIDAMRRATTSGQ
jgi:phosphate transport system substrate-binding protein